LTLKRFDYHKESHKEFFFEKKASRPGNQKTFAPLRAVLKPPGTEINKVFLLLFVHKKKLLLPFSFLKESFSMT
jgi:hypothetical protein